MEGSVEGSPAQFDAAQEAIRHVDALRNRELREGSEPMSADEFRVAIKRIVEQAMTDDQRFWPFVDKFQLVVREYVKRERTGTKANATEREIDEDERDRAATVAALNALTQLAQRPSLEASQAFARAMTAAPLSGSRTIHSVLIRNLGNVINAHDNQPPDLSLAVQYVENLTDYIIREAGVSRQRADDDRTILAQLQPTPVDSTAVRKPLTKRDIINERWRRESTEAGLLRRDLIWFLHPDTPKQAWLDQSLSRIVELQQKIHETL